MAPATVVDADGPARLFVDTSDGIETLRCERLILATGSIERFLPFPGWTLPNVMGAGGLQALVKSGWDIKGKRVVVAGSGPLLLAVAAYLRRRGASIVCVVEQASRRDVLRFGFSLLSYPAKLVQGVALQGSLTGIRFLHQSWPVRAEGEDRVERLVVHTPDGDRGFECDLVACGFGLVPNTRIAEFLGCSIDDGHVAVDQFQKTSMDRVWSAGEATGIGGVDLAIVEGEIAGYSASDDRDHAVLLFEKRRKEQLFAGRLDEAFALRPELQSIVTDDTIVCRCEDVAFGVIRHHADVRDAKLQTRCGMGPCQGRICGPPMQFILGWERDRVRPPFVPVTIGALRELGGRESR